MQRLTRFKSRLAEARRVADRATNRPAQADFLAVVAVLRNPSTNSEVVAETGGGQQVVGCASVAASTLREWFTEASAVRRMLNSRSSIVSGENEPPSKSLRNFASRHANTTGPLTRSTRRHSQFSTRRL